MPNDFILTKLEPAEWLKLNAKLQQKKSAVRSELASRGVLKRDGYNNFDKYKYFSEAQYKILFTELFSTHGLELTCDEQEYSMYDGSEKQANGRTVRLSFTLSDCETGFSETSDITGEGLDKGDKAGYKAYTGALKYYLANTFMVATGDDAENDSQPVKVARPAPKQAKPKDDPAAAMKAAYNECKAAGIPPEVMKATLMLHIPDKTTAQYTPEECAKAATVLRSLCEAQ